MILLAILLLLSLGFGFLAAWAAGLDGEEDFVSAFVAGFALWPLAVAWVIKHAVIAAWRKVFRK